MTMKTQNCLTIPAAAFALALGAHAQSEPSLEKLIQQRDAKLAEPWVGLGSWVTDFDEARATAVAEGKLIFAYFTRSYAP